MNDRIPIKKMLTFGLLPSCLKKTLYRLRGNHIGKHVKLSLGSVIMSNNKFSIGDNCRIGHFTSIRGQTVQIGLSCNIRSGVVVHAYNIQIGNEVTISETAILRAGHLSTRSSLIIDDLVHIFPSTVIDPSRLVHLQEECAVGPRCSIFTHSSYKNILEGYPVSYGDVIIGKRAELTYNVFVAPGVTVGDDAIIAYGSYVNCNIPSEVMAAGCPARIKRTKQQFAPTPTDNQKEYLLGGIITDFKDYLALKDIQYDPNDIRLDGISEVVIVKDNCHFDLINRRCDPPESVLSMELRKFLSRYGIRFKATR